MACCPSRRSGYVPRRLPAQMQASAKAVAYGAAEQAKARINEAVAHLLPSVENAVGRAAENIVQPVHAARSLRCVAVEAPIHWSDGMPFNGDKCHDAIREFTGWSRAAGLLVPIRGSPPVRIFAHETCRFRPWRAAREGCAGSWSAGSPGTRPSLQPCAHPPEVLTWNRPQCICVRCIAGGRLQAHAGGAGARRWQVGASASVRIPLEVLGAYASPDSWEIPPRGTAKTDGTGILAVSAGQPAVWEVSRALRLSQFIIRSPALSAEGREFESPRPEQCLRRDTLDFVSVPACAMYSEWGSPRQALESRVVTIRGDPLATGLDGQSRKPGVLRNVSRGLGILAQGLEYRPVTLAGRQ